MQSLRLNVSAVLMSFNRVVIQLFFSDHKMSGRSHDIRIDSSTRRKNQQGQLDIDILNKAFY